VRLPLALVLLAAALITVVVRTSFLAGLDAPTVKHARKRSERLGRPGRRLCSRERPYAMRHNRNRVHAYRRGSEPEALASARVTLDLRRDAVKRAHVDLARAGGCC
jgi:hypothetical protein